MAKPKKPGVLPILRRVCALTLILGLADFLSFTWFAKGISWLYDDAGYSPFLSCPDFILNAYGNFPTGPMCRMQLTYSNSLEMTIAQAGLLTATTNIKQPGYCSLTSLTSPDYIDCYWEASCDSLCSSVSDGPRCPDPSTLQNPSNSISPGSQPQCNVKIGPLAPMQMPCYYVSVNPYCDSQFQVTPSNEIAMRGIVIASIAIVMIWLIAEILLRAVEISIQEEIMVGREEQRHSLPEKIAYLRQLVEERWAIDDHTIIVDPATDMDDNISIRSYGSVNRGPSTQGIAPSPRVAPSPLAQRTMPRVPGTPLPNSPARAPSSGGFSSPLNSIVFGQGDTGVQGARERFSSSAWKRRVRRYHTLRADMKSQFKSSEIARSVFLVLFYFALIVVTLWVILIVSPQNITPAAGGGSIGDVLAGEASIWNIHTALDAIIFLDVLLDFGLFLIAAIAITWPKPPIFSTHLQKQIRDRIIKPEDVSPVSSAFPEESVLSCSLSSPSMASSRDTQSLSFVLKQSLAVNCCLMIACHESTITKEKSETFANTLRAALRIFPPSHIFICDNGASMVPVDDTQMVARSVHPDINYLYVPEGNKTFAFYWCNRYWIPFLERCGIVSPFVYAIIIDDDVPLPGDLHIPHEHLHQHPEIKAVHFPLTATTPDGHPGMLVKCQDVEYKLAALHKQFQSKISRCLSCHGAIALWERKAMEEVFFDHDTVFHGEDMYMGLCLLRKRDKSRIISASQTVVPTYAPSSFMMLFRQRVKSWELTSHRKSLTYLREFISPTSFCHLPSIALKPYFLQELITICLDWLRVFLICGLILRDWLGFLLMTALFIGLMYLQIIIFSLLVLRSRKDLRPSFFTFLLFPVYRLTGLLFRICALCQNLLVYSHNRTNVKIGRREDEIKDIPPSPPSPIVDWFTVWVPSVDKEPARPSRSRRRTNSHA